jgi:hypothetical protein
MMVTAMISLNKRALGVAAALCAALAAGGGAGAQGLGVRQSFRIGSGTGTLCTAEAQIQSPAYGTMFDRGYQIVCRDAAVPVGQLYVLRTRGGPDPVPRLAALRAGKATCQGSETIQIEGLGPVEALTCRLNADGTFTTGDAYFFQGTYNRNAGAAYTAAAAVNTCIIVTGQCPLRVPPDNGLDGPVPFTGPTDGSMAIMLPQNDQDDLIDSSFSADALIEEPVTSGSEPDLWNCDPDHDGDCDDQPQ